MNSHIGLPTSNKLNIMPIRIDIVQEENFGEFHEGIEKSPDELGQVYLKVFQK